jgi:putative serine protease PepD
VSDGSTAAEAGLRNGDVITRLDDTVITGADSLVATIRSYRPGNEVTLTYRRGDEELQTTLVLDSDAE